MSDTEQAWADAAKFDPAQGGMTLRQYAAIHLKQPNSGIDWLDDMIRQAKRDEFAGMALQGHIEHHGMSIIEGSSLPARDAEAAIRYANAMMEGRE